MSPFVMHVWRRSIVVSDLAMNFVLLLLLLPYFHFIQHQTESTYTPFFCSIPQKHPLAHHSYLHFDNRYDIARSNVLVCVVKLLCPHPSSNYFIISGSYQQYPIFLTVYPRNLLLRAVSWLDLSWRHRIFVAC